MSLKLDLSKDELWYAKLLAKGQVEFEELDFEKQLMMYEANVKLDTVPNEQIREFEEKLAMKGYFGITEIAKAAARRGASRIRP